MTVNGTGEMRQETLVDYLENQLSNYSQEFAQYFYKQCRGVIKFFAEAELTQTIHEWFFDEDNHFKLPYKAKDLINQIQGLSNKTKDKFSFIRQFRLAEKLSITSRWLRELAGELIDLGFLFSRRNRAINYKLTFDLSRSVIDYFETLIQVVFDYYSNIHHSNNSYTDSSSQSTSEFSSASQQEFCLASLMYTAVCNPLTRLEEKITKKNKEKRSMHANGEPANSNYTTSENKQEEPINSSSNTNSKTDRDDHKEPPKSQYDYEMCERFVIEYAKRKLATRDEIKDLRAFALYCYETGDKDVWIKLFIENNFTLTPYNPIKDHQPKYTAPTVENDDQADQAKASQTVEIKGRYAYEVYKDFATQESKRGRKIHSIEALATWLHQTGKQDKQVAKFIEEVKEKYIGGKPNVTSTTNNTSNNTDKCNSNNTNESPELAKSKAELKALETVITLGNQAWGSLSQQQKSSVMELASSKYKEKYPPSTTSRDRVLLENHLVGKLSWLLGQLLFNSNTCDLAAFGKHLWEQLGDEEVANFFDEGIANLEQNGVDVYASDKQQELLSIIKRQMEWELVVRQLVKRM